MADPGEGKQEEIPYTFDEFAALAARARLGELGMGRLREAFDRAPSIWRSIGDVGVHAEKHWIERACAADPVLREAITRKVAALKADLAGVRPSPLASVLVQRIALAWLQLGVADVEAAQAHGQGQVGAKVEAMRSRQEKALFQATRLLAEVQKLAAPAEDEPVAREEVVEETVAEEKPDSGTAPRPSRGGGKSRARKKRDEVIPPALLDRLHGLVGASDN